METTTNPNPEQMSAIAFGDGPLRIMAGAGTGKTFTLTQRITSLVQSGKARPSQILALTFTNKAATELEVRINQAVRAIPESGNEQVDIDTYNAFGGRIVAEHGHVLGLPPDPLILTTAEAWILLWQALDRVDFQHIDLLHLRGGGFAKSPLFDMLRLNSRLSDELSTLDDLEHHLAVNPDHETTPKLRDYVRALRIYEARKQEAGAIDYGDQIALACTLLAHPEIAAQYHARYTYLLVDEFQDTNYAQSVMVQRLAGNLGANVCVVGDPNQAIYSFRGASPDNIERFAEVEFPGAETISLSQNFRSTAQILEIANAVWSTDPGDFRGNLQAANKAPGLQPVIVDCEHPEDEIAYIVDAIAAHIAAGRRYGEIAIIARKNKIKGAMYDGLRDRRIPCEVIGGTSLYETPEVRELISYLRTIGNPADEPSLAHVLCTEQWGLDERALYELARGRPRGETLIDTLRRATGQVGADSALRSCLAELDRLSELSYRVSLGRLVEEIVSLRKGGYDELEQINVHRFVAVVRAFAESRVGEPQLADLLAYLDLLLNADPEEEAGTLEGEELNTVKVMTSHASKGLEWPIVFVCGANKNDFINRASSDILPAQVAHPALGSPLPDDFHGDTPAFDSALKEWRKGEHQREELRVLYVALTRAREELTITWSRKHPTRKNDTTLLPALKPALPFCRSVHADPAPPVSGRTPLFREVVPRMFAGIHPLLDDGENRPAIAEALGWRWERAGGDPAIIPLAIDRFLRERDQLLEEISIIHTIDARNAKQAEVVETDMGATSYTQLETFKRCPHLYYLRYISQLPTPPEPRATAVGTAFHEAIAREAETRKLGRTVDPDEFRQWFSSGLSAPGATRITGIDLNQPGTDFLETYRQSVDASAIPLLVEGRFSIKLGELTIHGAIDRIHRLPDGTTEIVDYKTDRHPRTELEVRRGWQLPIYLLACREVFREIQPTPTRAAMFFVRTNDRITIDYPPEELEARRAEIEAAGRALRAITPELHTASADNCRWCDYRHLCKYAVPAI